MALQTTSPPAAQPVATPLRRVPGTLRMAFRRQNLSLAIPVTLFLAIVGICFLGPWIGHLPPPSDSNIINADLGLGAPGHLLGTDPLGNDMLSRLCYGGRVSIEVGFGTVALGFLVGSALGTTAGYFGGWLESVIMRALDVLLAFPSLILAMAVSALLGPSERDEIFAIAFFTIPLYARLSRAATLRLREREFILATRLMGGRPRYVTVRHIFPNIVPTLMTFAPLGVGVVMLVEAALSYLGLGIRPPAPSWGNMITVGQQYLSQYPINLYEPAIALLITVVLLNLIGEQVRMRWNK
jgi:peptide/nickel transport system permease protein